MSECRVCLGQHDVEFHEAATRVHQWFLTMVPPTVRELEGRRVAA